MIENIVYAENAGAASYSWYEDDGDPRPRWQKLILDGAVLWVERRGIELYAVGPGQVPLPVRHAIANYRRLRKSGR